MKKMRVLAIAALVGGTTSAVADGVPAFERDGFPLTQHQVQTLGPQGVRERAPASTLLWEGMPASPHQQSVLRPKGEARG